MEKLHTFMVNSNNRYTLCGCFRKAGSVCITNGINPEKIVVIHNGVDLPPAGFHQEGGRAALGVENDSPVVFTAGRMTHQKAHTHLLRAFKQSGPISNSPPCGSLVMALCAITTYKPISSAFASRSISSHPQGCTRFDGRCRYFACLQFQKATHVVIEAMAAGLPVV
jgi:hypothetical protein